ncbi:MAG TPA: DUF481 domain-containing protein [Saprospiraceae bacterium]|nr:DUF481 domain-containing protein [Saprospiraceae bacterium]
MKRIFVLFVLLGITTHAQIINTESLRMVTDTSGWSGSVSLNIGLVKNVKELVKISNKIHVQYKTPKHLVLFMNDISFDRADGDNFINKGVQHLRYNYRFKPRISWEFFLQNQYNAISKIAYRRLAGTGFRFKLSTHEKYKAYLGSLVMYETEKTTEFPTVHHKDWRNSTYFSFSFYFNDNISLISTTYYQPKLREFSDYRMAHQSTLALKIFKNLSFKTAFNLTYDSFPVNGIPKKQYQLINGLVYSFD